VPPFGAGIGILTLETNLRVIDDGLKTQESMVLNLLFDTL
jgi:hypothetical protein